MKAALQWRVGLKEKGGGAKGKGERERECVVGDKSEDHKTHRLAEGSDSEEEDNVPVGPQGGEEPSD